MSSFFLLDDTRWHELGDGNRRKSVGRPPEPMSVPMQFDKGAVGTPQAHDAHEQFADVIAGRFECEVGGRNCVLAPGDAFVAPRLTMHGVVALEDGAALLDQFPPRRDDCL